MKSRFHTTFSVLLVIIWGLACGSCSSTPSVDDKPPTEEIAAPKIQLPESIPNSTRLLMRIDPERTGDLVEGFASHLGLDEQLLAQQKWDWGDATIQFFLSGGTHGMSPSEESLFSHRSSGEPIIVALGWPDDHPTLRNLRLGAPYSGEEFADIPLGIRIFVPSQNPEALIEEVDAYCEDSPFACALAPHMEIDESYALLDIPLAVLESSPQDNLFAEANADVFERNTLATRGFLDNDAAFSAYMRTEALPEWAALIGLLEMWMALEQAAPEDRLQTLSRGLSFIHSYFVIDSPEAREVEDFATAIDITDDGDVEMLSYETFTEQGRRVHSSAKSDVQVPSIDLDDPAFELEWAHDITAARDASTTPFWLSQLASDEQGLAIVAETFRDGGIWPYHMAWSSYRTAFPAGLEALFDASDDLADNPLTATRGLVALRTALGFRSDRASPMGLATRGGVVAFVETDSAAKNFLDELVDDHGHLLEQFDLQVKWRDQGSHSLLMLWTDGADIFGSPSAVDEFRATFDASNLEVDSAFIEDIAGSQFATLKDAGFSVSGQRTSSKKGLVTRLSTAAELEAPTVPSMYDELIEPEGFSACFRRAVHKSPAGLEGLSRGEDPRQLAYETRKNIDEARSSCDELSPEEARKLQWLSARWLSQMALLDIFRLRFDDARTHFETACDEGDQFGCDQHEALASWDFQLAEVDTPALKLPPLPSSVGGGNFPVANASGLFEFGIGRFQQIEFLSPTAIDDLDATDASHRVRLERLVHPVDIPDKGLINLVNLAPEQSMPAGKVYRLINLFGGDHFELSGDYKWSQPWELRDELSTDLHGVALIVDLELDGEETPAIVFGFQDTEFDDDSRLFLELDAQGIDVSIGTNSLRAVDDCPDDGPTICLGDDAHPWRDAAPFEKLRHILTENADTTPEAVIISTDEALPFEAVAKSASTAWASFDFEKKDALSFYLTAD